LFAADRGVGFRDLDSRGKIHRGRAGQLCFLKEVSWHPRSLVPVGLSFFVSYLPTRPTSRLLTTYSPKSIYLLFTEKYVAILSPADLHATFWNIKVIIFYLHIGSDAHDLFYQRPPPVSAPRLRLRQQSKQCLATLALRSRIECLRIKSFAI
jgi:hypothetical protein